VFIESIIVLVMVVKFVFVNKFLKILFFDFSRYRTFTLDEVISKGTGSGVGISTMVVGFIKNPNYVCLPRKT